MNNNTNNYRPSSPDLSTTFVPPPTLGRLPSYSRPSGDPYTPFSPRASVDFSATPSHIQPHNPVSGSSYFGDQHQVQSPSSAVRTPTFNSPNYQANFNPYQANALPRVPPYFHQANYSQSDPYYGNPEMARTRAQRSAEQQQQPYDPVHSSVPPPTQPRFQPQPKTLAPPPEPEVEDEPLDSAVNLDIKTRFPVARIKRIMQADEDIGKVAQATPTATAKALELFMASLTVKAAAEARNGGSKRITVSHLKAAIARDPNFDFLNTVCEQAPDDEKAAKKGGRSKSEDSDDEGQAKVRRKGSAAATEDLD